MLTNVESIKWKTLRICSYLICLGWSKCGPRILRKFWVSKISNSWKFTVVAILTCLFSLSMALSLQNLQYVEVKNCNLVEHIISEAEVETIQKYQTILPSLYSNLQHLTKLSSFCSTYETLECLSLNIVEVLDCSNMELFASTSLQGQESSNNVEEMIPNSVTNFLGTKVSSASLFIFFKTDGMIFCLLVYNFSHNLWWWKPTCFTMLIFFCTSKDCNSWIGGSESWMEDSDGWIDWQLSIWFLFETEVHWVNKLPRWICNFSIYFLSSFSQTGKACSERFCKRRNKFWRSQVTYIVDKIKAIKFAKTQAFGPSW